MQAEILNRERVLVDEKSKIACEGHPVAAVSGGETLASTGYTGTGTNTGAGYSSSGTGTGYSGTGTGVGTGSGYNNSGRNTTGQTTGEKVASYIPGKLQYLATIILCRIVSTVDINTIVVTAFFVRSR